MNPLWWCAESPAHCLGGQLSMRMAQLFSDHHGVRAALVRKMSERVQHASLFVQLWMRSRPRVELGAQQSFRM